MEQNAYKRGGKKYNTNIKAGAYSLYLRQKSITAGLLITEDNKDNIKRNTTKRSDGGKDIFMFRHRMD